MADSFPRTLRNGKRWGSVIPPAKSINSAGASLDTGALVQESVFHVRDTTSNIEVPLEDTCAPHSPKTLVTAPTHPHPVTSTASLSMLPMQLAELHLGAPPSAYVAAVNPAPQQPKPSLVLHPFLIKELAADFPAVQTTAVSVVISAPQAADNTCATTINDILCTTDDLMSELEIPPSRRKDVLISLQRLIVRSGRKKSLEPLLPSTWAEAARFLQGFGFEILNEPSMAALEFALAGLPRDPPSSLLTPVCAPSSEPEEEYSYQEALANMRKLWRYLKSSNRPSINDFSPHLQTIELPDKLWWPVGFKMRNILFARPSQQNTLNEIMEAYKETRRSTKVDEGPTGFIVKGTPGIGE